MAQYRIAVLVASISRNSGGLFFSLQGLYSHIRNKYFSIKVFSGKDNYSEIDLPTWIGLDISIQDVIGPKSFGYRHGVVNLVKFFQPSLIHTHGLWMYSSVISLRCSFFLKNIPTLISPHGMLDEWALNNSNIKKQLARIFYQDKHLKSAKCIHALCESEYISIRKFGLKNPVAIIPNGVNLPDLNKDKSIPNWSRKLPLGSKVLLFLGRIHIKKGITLLIQAWSDIQKNNLNELNNWHLVIAGWGQDTYGEELLNIVQSYGLSDTVHFIGPQFGDEKISTFQRANAFILPSYSEGLPMAVLEAWSYSLPVIMTNECNIPEGFLVNAAIKINTDTKSICSGLRELTSYSDEQLKCIGKNGRQFVERNYSWIKVAEDMAVLYEWLISSGDIPKFVKLK